MDVAQMRDDARSDGHFLAFAQFEDERLGDVMLFDLRLTEIKLPRLTVMVGKGFGPDAKFWAAFFGRIRLKTPGG